MQAAQVRLRIAGSSGVLPASAEGHHRVRRAEDPRLSELQRGGKRHSVLPDDRTERGKLRYTFVLISTF